MTSSSLGIRATDGSRDLRRGRAHRGGVARLGRRAQRVDARGGLFDVGVERGGDDARSIVTDRLLIIGGQGVGGVAKFVAGDGEGDPPLFVGARLQGEGGGGKVARPAQRRDRLVRQHVADEIGIGVGIERDIGLVRDRADRVEQFCGGAAHVRTAQRLDGLARLAADRQRSLVRVPRLFYRRRLGRGLCGVAPQRRRIALLQGAEIGDARLLLPREGDERILLAIGLPQHEQERRQQDRDHGGQFRGQGPVFQFHGGAHQMDMRRMAKTRGGPKRDVALQIGAKKMSSSSGGGRTAGAGWRPRKRARS